MYVYDTCVFRLLLYPTLSMLLLKSKKKKMNSIVSLYK